MYEVEVTRGEIYALGVFTYFAETQAERRECERRGMHVATDREMLIGRGNDVIMGFNNQIILLN